MTDDRKARGLVFRVGEEPTLERLDTSLKGLYDLLGCDLVQAVPLFYDEETEVGVDIWCDDEGKLRDAPQPNRPYAGFCTEFDGLDSMVDVICGDFCVLASDRDGSICDLSPRLAERAAQRLPYAYVGLDRAGDDEMQFEALAGWGDEEYLIATRFGSPYQDRTKAKGRHGHGIS